MNYWTGISQRAKWVGFLWLIGFPFPSSSGSVDLSFEQALEVMHATNESIRAGRMEENQRQHERSAARGLYFPKVTTSGRYTRIDEPISIDLNPIRSAILGLHSDVPPLAIPSFEQPVQDERFWRINAQVVWPVFTGGRIRAANRAAEMREVETQEKRRRTEHILITELVRRYFGVRLAKNVVSVRKQVLDGIERHLFEARRLEENGMIAPAERLHAEVSRAEADREYKKSVRNLEMARSALYNILSSHEDFEPVSPFFLLRQVEPLENFRQQAIVSSPILRQIAAQQGLAHQNNKKERGAFFPDVYLFGSKELYKDDLTLLDPEWAVGIGVNFSIFEGGSRLHRLEAARYLERKVEALGQRAQRDVETLVEKRYDELQNALEQFESIETSFEFAEEYLRMRTRAFEEGLATSLDVVDAQLALMKNAKG